MFNASQCPYEADNYSIPPQRFPSNGYHSYMYLSLCVRKPTICMGENKDADQLRGNREADQRLCFRYTDSTFPPLLIPKFSRFWVSSVTVQAGLCWTWSETQIVGFVMHRLISETKLQELQAVNCLVYTL